MRLLFLSNFYPPHSQGGYEQLCREVALLLVERGHEVVVVSGKVRPSAASQYDGPVRVHRLIELEVEGGLARTAAKLLSGGKGRGERRSVAAVKRVIDEFDPDVALIWGMWNVPRVVPAAVESLLPTAYYLCDYWPTLPNAYLQRLDEQPRSRIGRLPKRLMSAWFRPTLVVEPPIGPLFAHVTCVSQAIRDILTAHGIESSNALIRNGIQLSDFVSGVAKRPRDGEPLHLVYAGRVTPDKGVSTAIDAVRLLEARESGMVYLTIFGDGETHYLHALRNQVDGERLPVNFRGFIPRAAMPGVLSRASILILPSIVAEALPRVILEAMAAGLVVIGTTTGGTGEVLVEGETGLTFCAGDAADLARQIDRLAGDPELRARLTHTGREVVLRDYSIDHTVDQLEALLCQIARPNEVAKV